ncbi:Peroxisomal membrane protein 13 [Rhynchospora pubera]|uniref:Peroxin-13 n=1 Tax=Rhynchospora pubera TaxID=906938 RepID=A0AAV8H603_9POAL|nr:Peroxisomal membrane protein 13 [Rhynchospora pubera]
MATNSAPPGNGPPPKPWERAGSASGPAPFKPPSAGTTSNVVEASGTAKPGEVVPTVNRTVTTTPATTNTLSRPVPPRPWEQNYGSSIGGYGSGMYGGGYGGGYGGSLYGNNSMYNSGYNSGYGGMYGGGTGMYGGGMYGGGAFGRPMGYGGTGMGMGMGMGMGPYGNPDDPNGPFGPPTQPPGFWISLMRVLGGIAHFFGRIATLVDQNTHAFHMFMDALLLLFDRSGMLYGELARFIFKFLGIRTTPRKNIDGGGPPSLDAPKASNSGNSWDNVWGDDLAKGNGH